MTARIRPAKALSTILWTLAIAWGLLYVGEYFGSCWVSEAGGDIGLAFRLQER